MGLLRFEHVTGKLIFVNPNRVSHVILREADKVLIGFSGLADDYVLVKGQLDDVQAQIGAALAS